MNYGQTLISCILLCLYGSIVGGQESYPSTKYQSFSRSENGNDWATSPPSVPDLGPDSQDFSSMSPDSWSTPPTSATTPDGAEPDEDGESTDESSFNLLELESNSVFRSSSYARSSDSNLPSGEASASNDTFPQPPSRMMRYPLTGDGMTGLEIQSPTTSETTEDLGGIESKGNSSFVYSSESYNPAIRSYRPDLGHRARSQTYRPNGFYDSEQSFEFENKKKEYPKMKEILATGRYFGAMSAIYLKPAFQANTAISIQGPGVGESISFDFDYEIAPHFRFGFESKFGPGIEMDIWQYDESSNVSSFTSDGVATGTSSTWMVGAGQLSRLTASNAGETLDTSHSIDVETFGISFFKEMKFKISRLNGIFGFRYSAISQSMDSVLSTGGTEVGRLRSRSDLNSWGPQMKLEYYRPVGHTKLEMLTSVGGSAMFGHRDQFVSNTVSGAFDRIGADEFVTMIDFLAGVQYKKMTAENRAVYARLGLTYQTWTGGGTAVDPQGDFGLRGFIFGVGYNR